MLIERKRNEVGVMLERSARKSRRRVAQNTVVYSFRFTVLQKNFKAYELYREVSGMHVEHLL